MREEQQHEDAGLWRDRSIADLRNRSFSHDRVAERYRRQQSQGTLQRTRSKNQRLLTDPNLQDKLFEQDAPDTRLSTTQSFRSASGGGGGGGGGGIAGGATFRSTSGGGDGSGDGGALGNTTSRNSFSAGHRSSTFVARRPRHSAGGAGAGAGAGAGSPRSLQWPSPQRSQRSASVPTTASMQQLLDRCAEQKTVGSAAGILALEGVSTVGCVLRARWRVEVKGVAVSDAQAAGSVLRWWCDERELPQLRGQEEMPLTTEAVGCVVACTLSPSATVADHGAAVTVSGETVRAAAAHAVSRSDAAPTTPRQLLPSFRASDGPVRVGETIRLPSIDRTLLIENPSWHFCPPGGSDGEEEAAAAFSAPSSVEELCVVGAPCVTVGPQHVGLALEVRLTFAGALPAKAALGVVREAEEGAPVAAPVSPPAAAACEWAPLEEVMKRRPSLRGMPRVASGGGSSRGGGGGGGGGGVGEAGGGKAAAAGSEEEEQILRFTSRGGRTGSVVSSVPSGHARGVVPGANPRKPSAAGSSPAGQARRRHSNKPKQTADSKCGCVVA